MLFQDAQSLVGEIIALEKSYKVCQVELALLPTALALDEFNHLQHLVLVLRKAEAHELIGKQVGAEVTEPFRVPHTEHIRCKVVRRLLEHV